MITKTSKIIYKNSLRIATMQYGHVPVWLIEYITLARPTLRQQISYQLQLPAATHKQNALIGRPIVAVGSWRSGRVSSSEFGRTRKMTTTTTTVLPEQKWYTVATFAFLSLPTPRAPRPFATHRSFSRRARSNPTTTDDGSHESFASTSH